MIFCSVRIEIQSLSWKSKFHYWFHKSCCTDNSRVRFFSKQIQSQITETEEGKHKTPWYEWEAASGSAKSVRQTPEQLMERVQKFYFWQRRVLHLIVTTGTCTQHVLSNLRPLFSGMLLCPRDRTLLRNSSACIYIFCTNSVNLFTISWAIVV